MADHLRPIEELLRIPIIGIENAIVVPAVLADEFELKTKLLDFVRNNPFFGLENDDPHSHIRRFYQITRTLRLNQVHDDVVKLILFPFSLKEAAETWLENEPYNTPILTNIAAEANLGSVALQGGRVMGGLICKKGDERGVCLVTKYCSKKGGKEVGKVLGGDVLARSWWCLDVSLV
ncbi:hypothetical protein Tco_0533353 [Tanacetum coccineum]